MDSLLLLIASLLVAGLLTWRLLIGSRHEARHERRNQSRLADEPIHAAHAAAKAEEDYSAVSIRLCNQPCDAVKELHRASFLQGEQPRLPLRGCDRLCSCKYAYHDDRRRNQDRRYVLADVHEMNGTSSFGDELRNGRDRRRRVEPYRGIY